MSSLLTATPNDRAVDFQVIDNLETLDASDIADLTDDLICRMDCQEMARVVRAVKARHLRPEVTQTLESYDRETLQKLVFLTRRCCRHQCVRSHQPDRDWPRDWMM